MKRIKEINVLDLLRRYKDWVRRQRIDFLQGDSERQIISKNLERLISDFRRADRGVKDAKKKRQKANMSDFLDWHDTHKKGVELWHNLASYALKHIDPQSKGNSKLFEFLGAATDFEDLLYGLEPYYRDHTLHSLWVYILGEHILRDHLPEVRKDMQWYLFNDIEDEKEKYKYSTDILKEAREREKKIHGEIEESKDAIWCIIALCHDLGYSLEKLEKLNEKVQSVLKFFNVPEFRRVGYSLDIEHQYLVSQFLEILATDIRIVPSDNYKDDKIQLSERVLVKCYRDDDIYWEFCRALEKKQHGILSAFLVYKILSTFSSVSVRGAAEVWGLDTDEAQEHIIKGNALYAIAEHTLEFSYLRTLSNLSHILILADELEEFSRLGRQLLPRKYFDTMAVCQLNFDKDKAHKKLTVDIVYRVAPYRSLGDFFVRKAEQVCRIYSLDEDTPATKEWRVDAITITCTKGNKKVCFHLDVDPRRTTALLPKAKISNKLRQARKYKLVCDEDRLFVTIGHQRIALRDWFRNLNNSTWKDDRFIGE